MKTISESLDLLRSVANLIGEQFGSNCEVVVHDYSKPFESSIVYIFNGKITGRQIGDSGTKIGLSLYSGDVREEGKFNYISRTPSGKMIRSSTLYIKDDNGKIIGSMCINFDITDLVMTTKVIEDFIGYKKDAEQSNNQAVVVYNSVQDLLFNLIEESINVVGVPIVKMTRDDKICGITYLNKRGAFTIKNSAQTIANVYNVSKFTIYNYINENIT